MITAINNEEKLDVFTFSDGFDSEYKGGGVRGEFIALGLNGGGVTENKSFNSGISAAFCQVFKPSNQTKDSVVIFYALSSS
jgi:hypothetical protein